MTAKHLNKTDYQRFTTCPAAAWHAWKGKASKNDDDAFLDFLADEGQVIGQSAKRLFRGASEITERDTLQAADATREALLKSDITLFEGCVLAGNFLARPDVLIRDGQRLFLIEVKSKAGNLQAHMEGRMLINMHGDIRAAWRDYVRDLAFQTVVVRRAYPDLEVIPYLLLPESNTLAALEEVEAVRTSDFDGIDIDEDEIRQRRSKSILKFFPAKKAIEHVFQGTELMMNKMEQAWKSGECPEAPLKYQCRNCEFRLSNGDDPSDGFHACWHDLAKPKPHIFDLYQLYSLKAGGQKLLADQKIAAGTTSLYDVSDEELHGEHAERQRIQLSYQKAEQEWVAPELKDAIQQLEWPIAFVDFETSMAGMPWYANTKPYEVMPFQFSAHIVQKDGSWRQVEWLNTEDAPPTLEFIRQLKAALEGIGSILVYTDYENQVLKDAIGFLLRLPDETSSERAWISDLLSSCRIVDQHQWVYDWYFHPAMTGKTSIKKVMPAVWNENEQLHEHDCFKGYVASDASGVLNPYATLPTGNINGIDWEVREGCAAMKTYRELIRGQGAENPEAKADLVKLLRQYVTLDTASQWMIFEHWRKHFGL